MRTILIALFLLTLSFSVTAQKIEHYYDWQWKPTEPNTARYYAILQKEDSLWHRQDYFIHEQRLQMDGFFKDSDSKVEEGVFHYYHPNGQLQRTGRYNNGKLQGVWLAFYDNGMLYDSATYENGNLTGKRLRWYPSGMPLDSSQYNADGSGMSISWYDNGNPSAAGLYAPGHKEQGKWQYFHINSTLSAVEVYDAGKLLSKQYFDEKGVPLKDTTTRDREATFSGGNKAWQNYLYKHIYFPPQYKLANADKAVVVVDWVINEDGTVSDVKVSTPLHPSFDKIAVEAVRRSPKWEPAISHNRTVKAYRRQPVTFAQ